MKYKMRVMSILFKHNTRCVGFTLSEVLITLGIIGVIAAITIPALMQSTQDIEFKSMLKENVSILNQALGMYRVDQGENYGDMGDAYNVDMYGCHIENGAQFAQLKLGKYMPVQRYCSPWYLQNNSCVQDKEWVTYAVGDDASSIAAGCWSDPANIRVLNGHFTREVSYGLGPTFFSGPWMGGLLLKNGACMVMTSGSVFIDLNCQKKPNTIGRDIHQIFLNVKNDGSKLSFFSPVPGPAGYTTGGMWTDIYADINRGECSPGVRYSNPDLNDGWRCATEWLQGIK